MTPATIEIAAPSRLHFGMFSFGRSDVRQFGGVGAMLRQPGLRVRFSPADHFRVSGPLADRAAEAAERMQCRLPGEQLPPCHIEILLAPPDHIGLGTGTQLAMAVAVGLSTFCGKSLNDPAALAWSVGRGERSAIGTYGFLHGGLLIEAGKFSYERLSPLEARVELPNAWRFVLLWANDERGLSGAAERSAFATLPPVAPATTVALQREAHENLLPAARAADFDRFSDSLYRFGYRAGMCFAVEQGGPFASPRIQRLVESIRLLGVRGAGQSSWGPTVFALLPDQASAETFVAAVRPKLDGPHTITIAQPCDTGAVITQQPGA